VIGDFLQSKLTGDDFGNLLGSRFDRWGMQLGTSAINPFAGLATSGWMTASTLQNVGHTSTSLDALPTELRGSYLVSRLTNQGFWDVYKRAALKDAEYGASIWAGHVLTPFLAGSLGSVGAQVAASTAVSLAKESASALFLENDFRFWSALQSGVIGGLTAGIASPSGATTTVLERLAMTAARAGLKSALETAIRALGPESFGQALTASYLSNFQSAGISFAQGELRSLAMLAVAKIAHTWNVMQMQTPDDVDPDDLDSDLAREIGIDDGSELSQETLLELARRQGVLYADGRDFGHGLGVMLSIYGPGDVTATWCRKWAGWANELNDGSLSGGIQATGVLTAGGVVLLFTLPGTMAWDTGVSYYNWLTLD
ncbi:MAG: hypothetical protein IAG10_03445, partial [Planctomycetaceae bacterium]|nr:hypothetical protein [Planctomycetaceae bacterium]